MVCLIRKSWLKHKFFKPSDSLYKRNQKFFLTFFIREKNNPKILDLGCNDGSFTLEIAKMLGTKKLYGIELNRRKAKLAKKKNIKVKIADLNYKFPYPSDFFDIVSANQVLEHLWNTPNFFKEINRVLKKNGYSVISVPNLSSFHNIFFILLGQQPPTLHLIDIQVGNFLKNIELGWPSHMKAFTMPALRDLAYLYGFKVERIEGYGFHFLPSFLNNVFSKLFPKYTVFLTVRIRKIRDLF